MTRANFNLNVYIASVVVADATIYMQSILIFWFFFRDDDGILKGADLDLIQTGRHLYMHVHIYKKTGNEANIRIMFKKNLRKCCRLSSVADTEEDEF